jgi:hypothetical protein
VAYTTLVNPCRSAATLTGLTLSAQQPGSSLEWTKAVAARPLPEGAVPDAVLPGSSLEPTTMSGLTIRPSETVQVMAQVRMAGPEDQAQRVPVMQLGLTDAGGPDQLILAPDIRLCACNPLN